MNMPDGVPDPKTFSFDSGERAFRQLCDNAPVLIWRAGQDKLCEYFNAGWLRFTGRSLEQELGNGWTEGLHPEDYDRCVDIYSAAFDERRAFRMIYRLRRHDGAYRWIVDDGVPYFDADGGFAGYMGTGIDITDRIEAEERLKRALKEKEVLLQELQHRVRNNMQLVISMLGLQTARADNDKAREQLREAAARIRAIALVQEQLHQGESLMHIDLARYLRSVAETLIASERPDGVPLNVSDTAVPVTLARAVPIGLMVHEMVSNSLKHAYPDRGAGPIAITVTQDGKREVTVTVADEGTGLAAQRFEEGQGGLGFQIIKGLAAQAKAAIDMNGDHGTRFTIRFAP